MRGLAAVTACVCLGLSMPAAADMFSTRSQRNLFSAQTKVLDTRASQQYSNSVRLQPPTIHTPSKWGIQGYTGKYKGQYLAVAREAARKHAIPEDLFLRLVQVMLRPDKVDYKCPDCGLKRHDRDAIHCKACGRVLHIEDEGDV